MYNAQAPFDPDEPTPDKRLLYSILAYGFAVALATLAYKFICALRECWPSLFN